MARWVGVSTVSFDNHGCEVPGERDVRIRQSLEFWGKLIDQASLDKPDIIILPEIFVYLGPNCVSTRKDIVAASESLENPGPIVRFLSRKAKEHGVYLAATFWRKGAEKKIYNSAVFYDRKGRVFGVYDKMFPTIGEMEKGILPGQGAQVFKTDFGRIGAVICFDLNFREIFLEYRRKQAELLCFLSAFRGGFMVPVTAFENQIFIASATPGENSVIVDPLGRKMAESSDFGRVIFSRINLDSKIVHIDYHINKTTELKAKYRETVSIEVASPEAFYFISSLHPKKNVEEMLEEFKIETCDQYLERSRKTRQKYLELA